MNFKPLHNEKEYENTKKCIKDFERLIKSSEKEFNNAFLRFTHQIAQLYYAKNIMEAEIQDYEHRINGDYSFVHYNIKKGEPIIVETGKNNERG